MYLLNVIQSRHLNDCMDKLLTVTLYKYIKYKSKPLYCILKLLYIKICTNLHILTTFILALHEQIVTWREKEDFPRLSQVPKQPCGWSVKVV